MRPCFSPSSLPWGRWRAPTSAASHQARSEEHTSELQSLRHLVCRLLLEKKNTGPTPAFPFFERGRRGSPALSSTPLTPQQTVRPDFPTPRCVRVHSRAPSVLPETLRAP